MLSRFAWCFVCLYFLHFLRAELAAKNLVTQVLLRRYFAGVILQAELLQIGVDGRHDEIRPGRGAGLLLQVVVNDVERPRRDVDGGGDAAKFPFHGATVCHDYLLRAS